MIVYDSNVARGADLDGEYRYSLWRCWAPGDPMVFIMLNPSTADATLDDPTIRRCIWFATRERCAGVLVVNLFAVRTKSPALVDGRLGLGEDVIGPHNDTALAAALMIARTAPVVAAWGAPTSRWLRAAAGLQALKVEAMAARHGRRLLCLGTTEAGHPRHPLYLRADSPLTPWPRGGET